MFMLISLLLLLISMLFLYYVISCHVRCNWKGNLMLIGQFMFFIIVD